ncbi:MAG: hypothetical protein M3Y80_11370 [Verrucomicrobiota bacterium]|nr:hypothetical protein [Verrucomicrobiota bacterium]
MKRRLQLTTLLAFVLFAGASRSTAAAPARSVSTSHQFIVYGADARLRGALCDLAENTKRIALNLLGEPDAWKTPILIHAEPPQANLPELPPAHLAISQTGFGLKLQLDLTIGTDVSAPAVERELLRAVFLEMMYRQQPDTPAGTAYVEPPEWLLLGALALASGRDVTPLADALKAPLAAERIVSLEEFLRLKPELLESPSRLLYRAYSAGLVALLRDGPEGRPGLGRFVGGLARAGNDPLAELRAHFPSIGSSADATQQTWAQALQRLTRLERYRLLSCGETERQLALALQLGIPRANQPASIYALEEFSSFLREPNARGALQRTAEELLLLSARSNPLYRPIIAGYLDIVRQLAAGKPGKLPERLAQLRATREHLTRRMDAIGDYLNWFEATQSRTASGAFEEYMKAAELAAERTSRRRDGISVYLDAIEAQVGE